MVWAKIIISQQLWFPTKRAYARPGLNDSEPLAVSAGIATSWLFQDTNRPGPKFTFLEQQFWMYFYGTLVNLASHCFYDPDHGFWQVAFTLLGKINNPSMQFPAYSSFSTLTFADLKFNTSLLLILALLSHSVGGMVVASILKHLDNVVKEYSYSLANIFCAIICAHVFPDRFEINGFIVISLLLLFTGIYFYEVRGKARPKQR